MNPSENTSKTSFLNLGAVLVLLVLCTVAGLFAGYYQAQREAWSEAKAKGFAWHSRETGVLQWKTSEELALTVMANGDALKLERAIIALRDPLPDGWNTSIDVTKLPQLAPVSELPQPLVPDVPPVTPKKR